MAKDNKPDQAAGSAAVAASDPSSIPTIDDRKREAGIPVHVDRERLATMGEVIFTGMEPSEAMNPSTSKMEPGNLVHFQSIDGRTYTTFIANIVLTKDLERIKFPFRGKIVKHGRTWVFA